MSIHKLILILLIPNALWAGGPYFQQKDPIMQQEFEQAYREIRAVPNGIYKQSSMTLQGVTVDSITVNKGLTYFNGVTYTWPSSQGAAASFAVNDGNGNVSWATSGRILQIVGATSATNFSTTSGTFQSTNLTKSITPTSASNKILILVHGTGTTQAGTGADLLVTVFRGSTNLGTGSQSDFAQIDAAVAGNANDAVGINYVDSPATTSSTAYTVKIANDAGATTVGFGTAGSVQSMTLIEFVP